MRLPTACASGVRFDVNPRGSRTNKANIGDRLILVLEGGLLDTGFQ
jgi:hypothetical protein